MRAMDSRRDFTSKKVFPGYFSELSEKANPGLSSAAPSGDAGNGNHTPAARLFHAHTCLYFELKVPTFIEAP